LAATRRKIPERERHMIQSKKFIHADDNLESARFLFNQCSQKGCRFNAVHYVTEMFSPLSKWHASDAPESDCKWRVHGNNARPYTAKLSVKFLEDNRMKMAVYPSYSLDVTLSGLCLLGTSKDV
jgi:hypothetical protein